MAEKSVMKIYRLSKEENEDLKKKAKAASMTEAQLVRLLLKCYNPPAAPGKEFHEDMNSLLKVAEHLYSLSERVALRNLKEKDEGLDEAKELMRKASRDIHTLGMQLLEKYLKGEKVNIKWQ